MGNFIDLTGKVFGRWTVIERAGTNKSRSITWLCRCECGTEREVLGYCLRNGTSLSCGCLNREIISLPKGQAAFNKLYRQYKQGAEKRGYDFELSKEEFRGLTKENCYYCGAEPKQVYPYDRGTGTYIYNGVDRIDNTKGYIMDNVVTCCGLCNWWKKDLTITEFIDHAKDIVNCMR